MPLNISGILVPFQLLIHPRLVLPNLAVKDIRHLDFVALRKAGYRGAVFDKDNCLTIPNEDTLVPELQEAWRQCRETFGEGNVLIVSNSAGTRMDAGGIQSESVTYYLQTPVLRHSSLKPAYSCIKAIRGYFSTLRRPINDDELIIVGDRIFTDVVMANRMRRIVVSKELSEKVGEVERNGPLSVWTTGVWEKEAMVMRWCEKKLVDGVRRWTATKEGEEVNHSRFVKEVPEAPRKDGRMDTLLALLKRT